MPTSANEKQDITNQILSPGLLNSQTTKSGTVSEMNSFAAPVQGMKWFTTDTNLLYYYNGSSWVEALTAYVRADTMGFLIPQIIPLFYGLTSTGATTIAGNTDLGSANAKKYVSLTINDTISLTGNTNMILVVTGTLATNTSGTIHVDSKGTVSVAGTVSNGKLLFADQAGSGGKIGGTGGSAAGGSGGGFGANGGGSITHSGGSAITVPTVPLVLWGVQGSAGGGNTAQTGGTGGGSMFIYANAVTGTGTFSAGGGVGASAGSVNAGTGGGSGGLIQLAVATTISGITINAKGGAGGPNTVNQNGGGGGGGIIHEYYGTSSSSTRSVSGGAAGGGGGTGASAGDTGIQDSTQI